jgi:predicted phosphodiesterase
MGMRILIPRLIAGVIGVSVVALSAESTASAASSITKGPWAQRVTSTSVVLRVEVDPPAPVAFDIDAPKGEGSDGGVGRHVVSNEPRALHAVTVDGLLPGTRYTYAAHGGGASREASFVTAPLERGDTSFRFLVYGDTRTDETAHAAVIRAMAPAAADFVVHTGDFVSNGASAPQWQKFFEIEAPLLSTRCVFSCVGNHELTDGSGIEYARFFGSTDVPTSPDGRATKPQHLAGTTRWGNVRLFLLNGMVSYRSGVDRAWLENALAAADDEPELKWRIVVLHHGPWSSGPHGNNAQLHDAGIVALFKAHKIDLVFSGHDHLYERGWSDGLAWVVSGGGGAPLYKIKSQVPQSLHSEAVHHFVEVGVTAESLQLVATRVDGSTIERCRLGHDRAGWDCDRTEPAKPPVTRSRCACDAVGASSTEASPALVTAVLASLVWIGRRRERSRTAKLPLGMA